MKTIYKSTTTLVLVSLLVFLSSFSVVQAQAQSAYIIVHALNPEGVEIASIEGMDPYCVEIYDGDTLIGYGAHDVASHNQSITISSGSHTIKVKFNGMTKEQNININEGETQELTFTFTRTELFEWFNGGFQYSDKWCYFGHYLWTSGFNIWYNQKTNIWKYGLWTGTGNNPGEVVGANVFDNFTEYSVGKIPTSMEGGQQYPYVGVDRLLTGGQIGEFKFSSVPYDLLGTGVKDEENQPPVASFTYSPENPFVGEEITFDASSSYDPDGEIVSYNWDFGDGDSAEGKVLIHVYTQSGEYTVTLTVTDNEGLASSASSTITGEAITISGIVFKDDNGNFVYDGSLDIPIIDATVTATLGEFKKETTTDSNGNYSIEVPAGAGYTLEVSLPAGVECYDPDTKTWGNHSTIKGGATNVSPPVTVDIPVIYRPLNYGPKNFVWELWHYGPIFVDKPNVILVHGTQLYIRPPFIPIGPHFGDGKVRGMPDNEFHQLDDLLQKKQYGQFNVWEFEYADTKIGRRYWTHGSAINYGGRLTSAIDYVGSLSNSDVSIIAHSLGGLVARYSAQNYGESYYYKVNKIITLATGHFGFEYTRPISIISRVPIIVEMQPGSQFLWDLNYNFEHGKFKLVSIAADNDGFVSQTSASLVECNENGSVNYDPNNTYFTVIPGDHASIKNIEDDTHDAFAEILQFLNFGYSSNIWSSTGSPYFTFRLNSPTRRGYPMVWIEESGRWILPWYLDMYSTYDRKTGYYAWTFRAWPDEEGLVKIYYSKDRYEEGWLTQGQSAIRKQIIENR